MSFIDNPSCLVSAGLFRTKYFFGSSRSGMLSCISCMHIYFNFWPRSNKIDLKITHEFFFITESKYLGADAGFGKPGGPTAFGRFLLKGENLKLIKASIISRILTIIFLLLMSKYGIDFRSSRGVFLKVQISVTSTKNQVKANF